MLIRNETGHIAGPLDVLCILHDVGRDRYHAAYFEERPLPGPIGGVMDTQIVRLKSSAHHTVGAPDLAGARTHLDALVASITVPAENIARDPVPWDGELGIVWVVSNWRAAGQSVGDVLPVRRVP